MKIPIYSYTPGQIIPYIPTPIDELANIRNGGDILKHRQRITGYWHNNKFINGEYEPSVEYSLRRLKYLRPHITKKLKL